MLKISASYYCCRRILLPHIYKKHTHSISKMFSTAPTFGIIIIGDEILKGQVQDSNSHFLCKKLFALGAKVKKISVIPDDLETIAGEVKSFSDIYTHVITAGGIGPTHDDITFEGVAKAFNEEVVPHPDLVSLCKKYFGDVDESSVKMKMAKVPESTSLFYGMNKSTGRKHEYPLCVVRNVYICPGIPELLEKSFIMLQDSFQSKSTVSHVRKLYLRRNETSFADTLNEANEKFKHKVTLGSYPELTNNYYKVKVTVESQDMEYLNAACQFLEKTLPKDSLIDYDQDALLNASEGVYGIVNADVDNQMMTAVRSAVNVIEEAFEKYNIDETCISFNGGKDCTALLHLIHAVIHNKYPKDTPRLKAFYVKRGKPFPDVETFIESTIKRYNLELIEYDLPIKEALTDLQTSHPDIKAIFMGTRSTDPHGSTLQSFSETDKDWPSYMRVNPKLSWTYEDVWAFIKSSLIPYCVLYDQGYTSLGSMENTKPNPKLEYKDEKGNTQYRPAYYLDDEQFERDGRK